MKITFLGTATSYGVPYVGCDCAVCQSDYPRNKRLRCSITVESGDTRLLVDTTPDLRQQLLRAKIREISAVLWTHDHNDHVIGLDDLRPISDRIGYIPGFAGGETLAHLRDVFAYVFQTGRNHGGFPRVNAEEIAPFQSFSVGNIEIAALPIFHGKREIFAYRFRADQRTLIYATDCSMIPEITREEMRGADLLVLDALRHQAHPTHFSVSEALEVVSDVQPRRALFTHIAHELDHEATNRQLPDGVQLAYDELSIEL